MIPSKKAKPILLYIIVRIVAFFRGIRVVKADTESSLREVYKIRYQVYVNQNYITPNDNRHFMDQYDAASISFLAYHKKKPIGTVRLTKRSPVGLPTEKLFNIETAIPLGPRTKKIARARGEIGRLAILQEYRGGLHVSGILLLWSLLNEAKKLNIKYLESNMPVKLANYYRKYGVGIIDIPEKPISSSHRNARKLIGGYFEQQVLKPYLIKVS